MLSSHPKLDGEADFWAKFTSGKEGPVEVGSTCLKFKQYTKQRFYEKKVKQLLGYVKDSKKESGLLIILYVNEETGDVTVVDARILPKEWPEEILGPIKVWLSGLRSEWKEEWGPFDEFERWLMNLYSKVQRGRGR